MNFFQSKSVQGRYRRGIAVASVLVAVAFILGAIPERFNGVSVLAIGVGLLAGVIAVRVTVTAERQDPTYM